MVSLWPIAKLYASLNNILEYYLLSPSKSESSPLDKEEITDSQQSTTAALSVASLHEGECQEMEQQSEPVSPGSDKREQTFVDTFVISHRVDGLIWLPLLSLLLEKLHFMTETEA